MGSLLRPGDSIRQGLRRIPYLLPQDLTDGIAARGKIDGLGSRYSEKQSRGEDPMANARHAWVDWTAFQSRDATIIMNKNNSVVTIYNSHSEAEAAVRELQQSGFEMKQLSIVGRDYQTEEHVVGYYNAGDRMKYWGIQGAFWGGIWGMLFGSAFFLIPGVGPLLIAGPLVGWILGALEGAAVVGGMSALGAGLFSLGIPENSVLKYETALKADKFVLIAHGSADEVVHAKALLNGTHPETLDYHQPTAPALDSIAK